MRRLATVSIAVSALCANPGSAHACFDGFVVRGEQLGVTWHTGGDFRMAEARVMARWGARVQALLDDDRFLRLESRYASELCEGAGENTTCQALVIYPDDDAMWSTTLDEHMRRVFDRAAEATGATRKQRARALAAPAVLYQVQIGSFRSARGADHLVGELAYSEAWEPHTFYSAGGFPAIHPIVYRHDVDVNGARFHRVIAGLFVDAVQARAHRKRLAAAGYASAIAVEHL